GRFCASFQASIADNLLKKAFRATKKSQRHQLVIAGGVAANSRLRAQALYRGRREGVKVFLPSRQFCTDNAAMIARAGLTRLDRGETSDLDLVARATWPLFPRRARP
ncbi:MAG: tRNA (adenosine(37)-N6)-threonylcarbamoyltransferase complex transferase subunit TsaD, partial [Myxococcota bacterium]